MAEAPPNASKLFSSIVQFGRALRDFVRAFEGKPRLCVTDPDPQPNEPPPQLILPPGEPYSEAAQLLTQHTQGWNTPTPSTLPVPTYAPATVAFGIVFIALGALTVWPLSIVGGLIFVFGLSKWIGDLLP